jgi:hypothetical protein
MNDNACKGHLVIVYTGGAHKIKLMFSHSLRSYANFFTWKLLHPFHWWAVFWGPQVRTSRLFVEFHRNKNII